MLSTLLGMMLCTTIYKGFDIKPVDEWAYNDAIKCADIIMDLDEETAPDGDDKEENIDESENDDVQIKEIIKFINKSALPIETQNVESETSDEGNSSGNNYYLFDNDYSQINERLNQIDNKLSLLSLLGEESDKIYLEGSFVSGLRPNTDFRLISGGSSLMFSFEANKTYYFSFSRFTSTSLIGQGLRFTVVNNYSSSDQISFYGENVILDLEYSFTPSIDCYLFVGSTSTAINENLNYSLYYINSSEQPPVDPDDPDDPDEPVDPDEPIEPDSNILDALNSIKAEIAKNNRFNNYEIYTDTEAFEASDMYLNKYQYETFKLLRYLVILAVCQIGALMLILFSWRSRNGNT